MKNRTLFLKECIADTIIFLMKEKPIEKITADEIAAHSNVGRATFFRHFKSKKEALVFKIGLLWYNFCKEKGIEIIDRFYIGNAYHFFMFNYEIKDLLLLLYSSGNEDILFEAVKFCVENEKYSDKEKYHERFLLFGLLSVLDLWIRENFKHSVDEMVEILSTILDSSDK